MLLPGGDYSMNMDGFNIIIIMWDTYLQRKREKKEKKDTCKYPFGNEILSVRFFCLVYPRPTTTVFIRLVWWKKNSTEHDYFEKKRYHYWFYRMDIELFVELFSNTTIILKKCAWIQLCLEWFNFFLWICDPIEYII